jgi:hypothetical protein
MVEKEGVLAGGDRTSRGQEQPRNGNGSLDNLSPSWPSPSFFVFDVGMEYHTYHTVAERQTVSKWAFD